MTFPNQPLATCATIILFQPDAQAWHNTAALATQTDCLLVVDNTPVPATAPIELPAHVHLLYQHNRGGIAGALNLAATKADTLGFRYLAFLDQDSVLPPNLVRRMVEFCGREKADMAGPRIFESGSGVYLKYKRVHRFYIRRIDTGTMTVPTEVSFMITSGSVLDLQTYRCLGGFREDFFIDSVDTEYCLRLQQAGGRLLINPDVEIRHAIGACKARPITKKRKVISNCHPAWRRYFIGFNNARTSRLYLSRYPAFAAWMMLIIGKEALAILLVDDDAPMRAWALVGGYLAGWWQESSDNPYMPSSARPGAAS